MRSIRGGSIIGWIRQCPALGAVCLRETVAVVLLVGGLTWGLTQISATMPASVPDDIGSTFNPGYQFQAGASGRELWLVRTGDGLYRRSLDDGQEELVQRMPQPLPATAIHSNEWEIVLITAQSDGVVQGWCNGQLALKDGFAHHMGYVRSMTFDDAGRLLVAVTENGWLRTWRRTNSDFVPVANLQVADHIEFVRVSHDARFAACASSPGRLLIWDLQQARLHSSWELPHSFARLAWSPDGAWLATVGEPGTLCLWDAATTQLKWEVEADGFHPQVVLFSQDGDTLFTGGTDHRVREWDASDGALLAEHDGHSEPVCRLALSPDGQRLHSSGLRESPLTWPVRGRGSNVHDTEFNR
jgi:hypothetical protein